jgi:hypothetical protein
MDDLRRLEAKGLARAKIRAKRRRVRLIRARATLGSLLVFAVVWAIVFGQLVTGNDPVLGQTRQGPSRPVAAVHHRSPGAAEPEAAEAEVLGPEIESAPEVETEAEVEEPAPVITSAS